jgi:3'-phosphoadenosine 5'-phosphosulfate sulfotransferase (PAPS reductase)/FAD synthetase
MNRTFTKQDLSVMQSWPLARKIQVTQLRILEWYKHYDGKVAVNFSGGLDSSVLLDLARRVCPDIRAAFVQTGMEYKEIQDFVASVPNVKWLYPEVPFNRVIKEYGYPVISKDVSNHIEAARRGVPYALQYLRGLNLDGTPSKFNSRYIKWAHLVDAPFLISEKCCSISKEQPLRRFTKETGCVPIIGTLASESLRRQRAFLITGCNAFNKREPSSQPLSFWNKQNILEYINLVRLPYASIYGDIVTDPKTGVLKTTGAQRTGCAYCMYGVHLEKGVNRFQRMARTHPKEYDYCINKLGCGAVLDYIGVPY